MLRYLRRLSARDYALDRGMIPLGSCTMKLNATTEMEPSSCPASPTCTRSRPPRTPPATAELIDRAGGLAGRGHRLRPGLAPAQRRLAGRVRRAAGHPRLPPGRGDAGRDVCLIPSSAHGTNAASAVMAGMRVVVVKAADDGTVDLDDLRAKCDAARRRPRRDHGDLPVDARRLRGRHHRALRDRARRTAARSTSTAPTSTRCSG